MKTGILLLFMISAVTTNAQSLKDALYSGKLKTDSGTVIRKGDDLSKKIDSSKKADVVTQKKVAGINKDSSMTGITGRTDSLAAPVDNVVTEKSEPKDNNDILKEFMDSFINTLKDEVLPNKKIKDGTYFILIDYEIGIDGEVTIRNVYPSPDNSLLQQQVKDRLNLSVPKLNPVLASNGKPRKVIRKYNFTITKE